MGLWEVSLKHFGVGLALLATLTAGNFELLSKSFYSHASPSSEAEGGDSTPWISRVASPPNSKSQDDMRYSQPRSPASSEARTPASLRQTKNVEIGCAVQGKRIPQSITQTQRFFSQESLMRLRGRTCLHESGFQMIKISNLTNGFTASIFGDNSSEFQTDFIQLNKGLNELVFELQNKEGEKFQEILYFELNS